MSTSLRRETEWQRTGFSGGVMHVHVDPDVCQGHGLCELSAPGVFHLREEDGQSYVLSEEVSPPDEANVRLAARGCPEQAITIS
jgi:ferredoxin